MADRQKLANALMQPPPEQPGLMGAAPDWRQKIGNALMGGADYAGRGLALADLYSGGMLSSVAGLNPFGSYSTVMEARDRALEGVPREAKAAATEPVNPLMAMAMVPAATKRGIKAFHGSPHDFDKFRLEHIGKGEGAQAYGHGLYFAESEGVAKSYRDTLSSKHVAVNGPLSTAEHGVAEKIMKATVGPARGNAFESRDIESALKYVDEFEGPIRDGGSDPDKIRQILRSGDLSYSPGRMYEVNINASPEDFLDWDKPAADQLASVRSKLPLEWQNDFSPEYPTFQGHAQTPEGIARLREAGIPGIKYLDQGSRTAGEGSRNYVLFRDDIVDIVRKYGMAAAVSMYGANAVMQATGGDQQQ
jgi:hypothetical protein